MHYFLTFLSLPLLCSAVLLHGSADQAHGPQPIPSLARLCINQILEHGIEYQGTPAEYAASWMCQEIDAERGELEKHINVAHPVVRFYIGIPHDEEEDHRALLRVHRSAQVNRRIVAKLIEGPYVRPVIKKYKNVTKPLLEAYANHAKIGWECAKWIPRCLSYCACCCGYYLSQAYLEASVAGSAAIACASCCLCFTSPCTAEIRYQALRAVENHYNSQRPYELIHWICCDPAWQRRLAQTPQPMIMEDNDDEMTHEKLY